MLGENTELCLDFFFASIESTSSQQGPNLFVFNGFGKMSLPVCLFRYIAPVLLVILLPLINIAKLLMSSFYLHYRDFNPFSG